MPPGAKAAPDIDSDIFRNIYWPNIQRFRNLTLYVSIKDKALLASAGVRGGTTRLGMNGGNDIMVLDGMDSIDAGNISTEYLGHGYYAETYPLIADIKGVFNGISPDSRLLVGEVKLNQKEPNKYWLFPK